MTDALFDVYLFEESHQRYSASQKYTPASAEDSFRLVVEEMLDAQVALSDLVPKLVAAIYLDMVR